MPVSLDAFWRWIVPLAINGHLLCDLSQAPWPLFHVLLYAEVRCKPFGSPVYKAYSQDLRLRVLRALDAGASQSQVAEQFAVSVATIKRYLKQRREVGHVPRDAQRDALSQQNGSRPTFIILLLCHLARIPQATSKQAAFVE
jgi:hypothetical protein